jgi:hypothetical protein
MSAAHGSFSAALRRQLVERDVSTGLQFSTCRRLLLILGAGRPADSLRRETISVRVGETISEVETISGRRGRPRKGAEAETISATRPWVAAGVSRASWYRRRHTTEIRNTSLPAGHALATRAIESA